ncbi:MAG: DUF58 domain-containing protein [Planctomycetes bacterium]|nr:DUF58 domain-containing protein [Planctomycetota bacterium]
MEAPPVQNLFDPRYLARFSRLEILARDLVEGFIAGLHRSPYKGFSVEFAEHRAYSPGDSLRSIDWRAYGKTERYFVKEYEEETNLRAHLVIDASGSMRYGDEPSKLRYALSLAASLAYLLLKQRDAVGIAVVREAVETYIPPKASADQFATIVRVLQGLEPSGPSAMARSLHHIAQETRRRGLIVVLSDLFEDEEALSGALHHLKHKQHDCVLFHLLHPDELSLPFDRLSRFHSLEDETLRLTLDPQMLRERYIERIQGFIDAIRRTALGLRIDYAPVTTATPYDRALVRILATRAALTRRRS